MSFWDVLLNRLTGYDRIILIAFVINFGVYLLALMEARRIHRHFHKTDRMSALPKDAADNIRAVTGESSLLSPELLLDHRERMNFLYSAFSIITTMFPLLGMLGTVIYLIPMVNSIGAENVQQFFGALTSTFWGIVCALVCKGLDIFIGYTIEDNEKHTEFLLNPKRSGEEGQ